MPFEGPARFKGLTPAIEHGLLDLRDYREILRHTGQAIDDLLQHFATDRSRLAFTGIFRLKNGRRSLEAILGVSLPRPRSISPPAKPARASTSNSASQGSRPHPRLKFARRDQLVFEKLSHRWPLLDFRVEIGLGERRFVALRCGRSGDSNTCRRPHRVQTPAGNRAPFR